jgi:hypothetical protein
MKRKITICFLALFVFAANAFAQDALKKWHSFDFSKRLVKKAELAKMEHYDLQLLRGIVFGKRGRIFVEQDIQDYLSKQSWYKPNKNYRNAALTATERKNIDLIREAEAARHDSVEPGDLRWWQTRAIPEEKIYARTAAEWDVLIAEIEAIHGKTFPENEWLQKYFDERYWYKRNPNYNASVLSEIERKNLQAIIDAKNKERKVAVSPGDMDKFQNALLKEEMLAGLTLNELRIMRNEFFARRGRRFSTPGYRSFYEWQNWYKPIKDQSKVKLNATEEANVKTIEAYERKIREKLTTDELTEDALSGLFIEDLRVLRNEIFARRGYVFKDKELQKTFEAMDWYKPDPTFTADKIPTVLSEIEIKNIATIKKAEEYAVSKLVLVEG